jgi:hypothetical protein
MRSVASACFFFGIVFYSAKGRILSAEPAIKTSSGQDESVIDTDPNRFAAPHIEAIGRNSGTLKLRRIKDIRNLDDLQDLWILRGPVDDADLRFLSGARNMEALYLPGRLAGKAPDIGDSGAQAISQFENLVCLRIATDAITDAGITHLAQMQTLLRLELSSASVTDAGLIHIFRMPNLGSVVLRAPRMTDAALVELTDTKRLSSLDVRGTAVTGTAFASPSNIPQLFSLSGDFTDKGLEAIGDNESLARGLGVLEVAGPAASDVGIGHIAKLKSLRVLTLNRSRATRFAVERLLSHSSSRLTEVRFLRGGSAVVLQRKEGR